MKSALCRLVAGLLLSLSLTANAASFYVDGSNLAPAWPYRDWVSAATNIQDAVDAAAAGDEIVVTNGVYAAGATAVYGMSNRVAVTKPVTLRSVNGPAVTVIAGSGPNGSNAVRCVYLTNGAVLAGFTLTHGATQIDGESHTNGSGGGIWCESWSSIVTNCVLTGNGASIYGGGAYYGTLNNCTLTDNSAFFGGGAYRGMLTNCTLTANSAGYEGGGASQGTLANCLLTGNAATDYGGGSYNVVLINCTLTGNAARSGGGAYRSILSNCRLAGNSASASGGGAFNATLYNCTLTANSAWYDGGGACSATLNNCIIYYNTARSSANYDTNSTLNYCCTTPSPGGGSGNTNAEPQLASTSHLSASSPCRGTGSAAYASGVDLDGEPWANPPSIGCDEYWTGSVMGALSVTIGPCYTNLAVGFGVDFQALIGGRVSASRWDFGDGVVVSNRPYASHAWQAVGDYLVELRAYNESYPSGEVASVTVHVLANLVHYVSLTSTNPVSPYTDWLTAATNIQDAADAAAPGAMVWVSDGVYQSGGRALYGTSNRVAVTKPVTVKSVNGPAMTVIVGSGPNGSNAVRCVYLTNGAALAGFTLTNGATQPPSGDGWTYPPDDAYKTTQSGGGVWCESSSAIVTNCVLTGNSASWGGGAYSGTLNNCTLTGNLAAWPGGGAHAATLNNCTLTSNSGDYGGGAYSCTLNNCTLTSNSAAIYGGGAYSGTLNNCTLTGNLAPWNGGGAYSGTLSNCTLTGNSVFSVGGGAFDATLNNCTLTSNSAGDGGGVGAGTLNNCTLTGNWATNTAGGAYGYATLNNCVIYYNTAPSYANYDTYCTLNYCCTTPSPRGGSGNINAEPQLASASHLSASSPCRRAGSAAYSSGVDVDGEPWANPPSIGCDEYWSGSVTGALSVTFGQSYTNVGVGFGVDFQALIGGRVSASRWDFGDGVVVSNQPCVAHAWQAAGDYVVELRAYNESYPSGEAASVTVHVLANPVYYVSLTSTNPVLPYTDWLTAATNIQDAVDAAAPGAVVWVSDGVYQIGGRALYGMSNRVAVTKPVTVRSVNGPAMTVIVGSGANAPIPVRCVYLTNGSALAGFTLTNGATYPYGRPWTGDQPYDNTERTTGSGGGVWCESSSAIVTDCVLTGNRATWGGGAYSATLNNCTLTGNVAFGPGGGAHTATLNNCTLTSNSGRYGGGAFSSTLNNCTLTSNSTAGWGGGARSATLYNCTLTGNSATYNGGGAYSATLYNCTLTSNSVTGVGGEVFNAGIGGGAFNATLNNCTLTRNSAPNGGGVGASTLNNCIVYYNTASTGTNYDGSAFNYCCTTPLPSGGTGNQTNAPLFVNTNGWSNLRLLSNSPCINVGNNAYMTNSADLDGRPRIVGGTVDMGAYEFSPGVSGAFIGWLQYYGLTTDGSADYADPDHDGMNNYQEWMAGTNPTNATSVLRVQALQLTPASVTLIWSSVTDRIYCVERATKVMPSAFGLLGTNIPGLPYATSFTDTNAPLSGPAYYRVGVQP